MDTIPNEIVSDAIDRAAMACLLPPNRNLEPGGRDSNPKRFSLFYLRFEALFETLFQLDDVRPAIARLAQALEHVSEPEIERVRLFQLLPGERHRHRRAGKAARRIGGVQGL